ncbi:MAG: Fe-S cluster assembly protein SufD [Planctomycetota bacterium]|nr:Fe-S cluster assembly protein SufD [Planctomycetota bacterium]
MRVLKEDPEALLSRFAAFESGLNGAKTAWAHELRRAGLGHARELGIPTTRNEEWRYTNVARLAKDAFELAAPAPVAPEALKPFGFSGLGGPRLVFVNGHFDAQLSSAGELPKGVVAESLKARIAAGDARVQAHLGRYARQAEHPFVALNTAFLLDGAFVFVPKGVQAEAPIHLLFVTTESAAPAVSHPRNLLVFEDGARAQVVEHYAGLSGGAYFTNAVTEAAVGAGANVDHTKLQQESLEATHIASAEIRLARDARYANHSISLGGKLTRNDVNAKLDGERVECTVNGFYIANAAQHVDNHTIVDHAQPHGRSYEVYKGVMDDEAVAVFNGKIFVRPGAQKTDAKQDNKHLLLSRAAEVQTKPQLEIFADDVKCTHGATVGQLDKNALFYLRARGIGRGEALRLLTLAFAEDVLKEIGHEALRADVAERVHRRMEATTALRSGA